MELWLEDGDDSRLEVYQNNRWVGATVSLMMTMIKLFSAGHVLGLRAVIGKNTDDQKILRVQSVRVLERKTRIVSLSGLARIRHSDPYLIIIDPYRIGFQWSLGG